MTLLIACILIYHFQLPWWVYLVAVLAFVGKLCALHFWEKTQTQNMDGRFNLLNRLLQHQFEEFSATFNVIDGHIKEIRDSCDVIETNIRETRRLG